ncbi:MarR family winged helix-turn-helix transcriptional regulator [uncultured Hydrogenophaga sp.]|uniref:MarR family winged helix-turn-helix transcriptional regulator n=1 Tax=uncultured Hydrogenophaga sp. TaxID=199683 RepID=UPI0026602DD0|nr:MarR family winged helix-turn-helix transcriptional regulator [uncultured Hydrogenophaga sp.]
MNKPDPAALGIDDMPGHRIRRLHQISVGIFLQELGDAGLTPVQFAALQTVAHSPGVDQRTLAGTIALDTSTTGGVVDRLEQRGWLERRNAPQDRRVRQLWLTDAGHEALTQAVPAVQRVQEQILDPLDEADRQTFLRLLHRLVDSNNAHSRAPGDPR